MIILGEKQCVLLIITVAIVLIMAKAIVTLNVIDGLYLLFIAFSAIRYIKIQNAKK